MPCPSPFNLAAHVLAAGADRPDHPALVALHRNGPETWSYRRLIGAVRGCGTGLLELGLRPGDRVLLRIGNEPGFAVAFLGAIAAGLVPVPTSMQLALPEVDGIAAEIAPALIVAGNGAVLPGRLPCSVLAAADLAGMADLPPCAWAMGPPDRLAYMIYTSGTSGRPRAVCHAHRAIRARRLMHAGWEGLGPDDRMLHAGAFNWTYTLGTGLLDPWTIGATALIPGEGLGVEDLPQLLAEHRVTIFAAAPGIYRRLLRQRLPPLPALRHGLSAGEKLPDDLARDWQAATGTLLHEALGMSEISTFVSGSPARPAPPGTIGYPQKGRRIAVLDPDGRPVPVGEPGILSVHRTDEGLFLGYLDSESESETIGRYRGDWFLTGDIVREEADGSLVCLGRDDDMMNAGGIRVSPVEVEAAMAVHPDLSEVAAAEVMLRPGVSVIACFYTAPEPLDGDALSNHASALMAGYKCPRLFVRVANLPRTPQGKLNRRALRRDWEAEHGQA